MSNGYVYFIADVEHGVVKIGLTTGDKPCHRLGGIQTGYPYKLDLIGSIRCLDVCPRAVESTFHKTFDHLRMQGEWFEISGSLKTLCEMVSSSDGPLDAVPSDLSRKRPAEMFYIHGMPSEMNNAFSKGAKAKLDKDCEIKILQEMLDAQKGINIELVEVLEDIIDVVRTTEDKVADIEEKKRRLYLSRGKLPNGGEQG